MISGKLIRFCKPMFLPVALMFAGFSADCLQAQMVSPSIDRPGQPFSYFSRPTDEIGMMDAEAATEITPEGYLRTGFGELMFFAGPELEPTNVRIRTLRRAICPSSITNSTATASLPLHSLRRYLDGNRTAARQLHPRRNEEPAREPTRAIFATGIRYDALDNTGAATATTASAPRRQIPRRLPPDRRKIQPPLGVLLFTGAFLRDGRLLYNFPGLRRARCTLHGSYNYPQDLSRPAKLDVEPDPVGIVTYSRLLPPGEESLDFKMPVVPTADAQIIAAIDQAASTPPRPGHYVLEQHPRPGHADRAA